MPGSHSRRSSSAEELVIGESARPRSRFGSNRQRRVSARARLRLLLPPSCSPALSPTRRVPTRPPADLAAADGSVSTLRQTFLTRGSVQGGRALLFLAERDARAAAVAEWHRACVAPPVARLPRRLLCRCLTAALSQHSLGRLATERHESPATAGRWRRRRRQRGVDSFDQRRVRVTRRALDDATWLRRAHQRPTPVPARRTLMLLGPSTAAAAPFDDCPLG